MYSTENPLFTILYTAAKKNNTFPVVYRICRVILLVEMILLLMLRDYDWEIHQGFNISNLYKFVPSIVMFLLFMSISELLGFFLTMKPFLVTRNKYLFQPSWLLRAFLILHYLNTIPVIVCLPMIFVCELSTMGKVYCCLVNLFSIAVNYFVQKVSYLMCFGVVTKNRELPEYYGFSFELTYLYMTVFTICVTVSLMIKDELYKIICTVISFILSVFLYLHKTRYAITCTCETNIFIYCLMLTLIFENIIRLIAFAENLSRKMVICLMIAFIPIAYLIEQEVTRRIYIYYMKKMKNVIKRENYSEFFNKCKPKDFAKYIQIFLRYCDNYKLINKAIEYYPPNFAIFESEFIIAQNKGDTDRMEKAYNSMLSLSKNSSIEWLRLYSYKAMLPVFVEEEMQEVVQDCKYYLNKYIFTVSKFWDNVVLNNISNIIAVSTDIERNYDTLTTIFQSYGTEGILGDCYKKFNEVCSINEKMNSQIKFNIELHANNAQRKKNLLDNSILLFQILMVVVFVIISTEIVIRGILSVMTGWSLVAGYGETVENLHYLIFLSTIIRNDLNFGIYEKFIYDNSFFVTKLQNQTRDAEFLLEQLTASIKSLKISLLDFKYQNRLDNIFYNSVNVPFISNDIVNISLISGIIIKENELRDIINDNSNSGFFDPWSYYSITLVSLRTIFQIADEVKDILTDLITSRDSILLYLFGILGIVGVVYAIVAPFICMHLYKTYFSSLFYLRKLELKEYSLDLQNGIQTNKEVVNSNEIEYKRFNYLKERVSSKEFTFSVFKYSFKYTFVTILSTGLVCLFLFIFHYAIKIRVSRIIEALSFAKYAFYLPAYMINVGNKFLDVCINPEDNAKKEVFSDIVKYISVTIAKSAEEITKHSKGIVNIVPYLSFKGTTEYQRKSCFLNMASTFVVSTLENLVTNETYKEHINWVMQIFLDMTTYYIPVLKDSLKEDLQLAYFDSIRTCVIALVAIFVFILIVLIFNYVFVHTIPNPSKISWNAIATMPSGVWNDFIEVIDPQMSNEEKKRIGQEIRDIFNEYSVLDKIVTPIAILNEGMKVIYMNHHAIAIFRKNCRNIDYQGVSIQTICDSCLKDFPTIDAMPFVANSIVGVVDKKIYNIQILEVSDKKHVFTIRNVTEEFTIRKQYINVTNRIKMILSTKTPYYDIQNLDITNLDIKQVPQCIISTWYIGKLDNPKIVKEVGRIIRELNASDKEMWVNARSITTFRIYFPQKHGNIQEAEVKAIEICAILMEKLRSLYQKLSPCCYINRSEERRTKVTLGEYLLSESLDESASNFIIPLSCCEDFDICTSRTIYESLYNNSEIEFSYHSTFGKETIYKLVSVKPRNSLPTVLSQVFKNLGSSLFFD